MKSKLSWILFVPLMLAAVCAKLAQVLLPDGAVFGLTDMQLDYVMIGCVVLIFLFTLVMCLVDKKISPYYVPHRNIPAGILGLLLAVLFAGDGADRLYHIVGSGSFEILEIAEAVFLALSAIVFVVLGLSHSFKNRETKRLSLFYVMPAFLCAVRMIICFVSFTTISITLADVTRLVCYIFATLFFFNYAVALSLSQAKNAVKSCFIYGFPAVAALLAYSAHALVSGFNFDDLFENFDAVEMALMGLYILAFIFELTIFAKDKDHVIIEGVDDVDYKDLDEDREDMNEEGFVVTGVEDEERMEQPESSYLTTADTTDFLYQDTSKSAEKPAAFGEPAGDVNDYITTVVDTPDNRSDKKSSDYGDRLDEIDKLILEISEDLY